METVLSKIAKFYDECIEKHGNIAEGVNWSDEKLQNLRFNYLLDIIPENSRNTIIAELGCGYGALYEFSVKKGIILDKYIGYDISENMVTAAIENIGRDNKVKIKRDSKIGEYVDYSFASGVFNVSLGHSDDEWKTIVLESLDNMNKMSKKGFAFNLMTDAVDWKSEELFYASASDFFQYCICKYSKKIRLFHDMPLYEWTIHVIKDN